MKMIKTDDKQAVGELINQLAKPKPESHKGQNGKVLIIGGGQLFHAPMIWAAEIASKIVDMVHMSSPAEENNHLMRSRLKEKFWNGIVVPWTKIDEYIQEDDCTLIGPGMPREEGREPDEAITAEVVNSLLSKNLKIRWVVDGGALQEADPNLLNGQMIITPHHKEWERLLEKDQRLKNQDLPRRQAGLRTETVIKYSKQHGNLTILLKGPTDLVVRGDEAVVIEGGNAGMTKGGTGDVLAGLVVALAARNDLFLAAKLASVINKMAGDELFKRVGTNFNASDLVAEIPQLLR